MNFFIKTSLILILFFCTSAFCRDSLHSDTDKTDISIFSTSNYDYGSVELKRSDGEIIDLNDFSIIETPEITLNKLNEYDLFSIFIENKKYSIIPQIRKLYGNEFLSISGYFESIGNGTEYFAVFTFSNEGLIGDFYLPEGHYQADILNNKNILLSPEFLERSLSPNPFQFDQEYDNNLFSENNINDIGVNVDTKNIVTLYVGFLFSYFIGDNTSTRAHMLNAVSLANLPYSASNGNIRLSVSLMAVTDKFSSINSTNDIYQQNNILKSQNIRLIYRENISYFIKSLPTKINQLVFVTGYSSVNNNICGLAGSPRVLGKTSTYRLSSNCQKNTLVHEIGHNLTLIHEDGAFRDPDSNTLEPTFLGWRSIMRASGQTARYFTGGVSNNVDDSSTCGGVCNTQPYSSHNSISIMNNIKNQAANNYFSYYENAEIDPGPTNNF